jgi:hypothetical protein
METLLSPDSFVYNNVILVKGAMTMLSKRLEKALNDQIVRELESAYIYLSMCAYFEAQNLRGMAHWMRLQAQEELKHAMKIFDFVNDRGGRVELGPIAKPQSSSSPHSMRSKRPSPTNRRSLSLFTISMISLMMRTITPPK